MHERVRRNGLRVRAEPTDPEQRLMAAILDDAEVAYRSPRTGDGASVLARGIEAWVEDTDRSYRFSFENVCDALGRRPDDVRHHLRTLRAGATDEPSDAIRPTAAETAAWPMPGSPPWPMGEDAAWSPSGPAGELAAAVATNVRRRRERGALSLGQLARRAGLEPSRLAAVERGAAVPDLRDLWQLAVALDVPFGALLEPTGAAAAAGGRVDLCVRRAGDGRHVRSAGGLVSRVLFHGAEPRAIEAYALTLAPGTAEEAAAHAPGTFEQIVVTRGTLTIRLEGEDAVLAVNDAVEFRADRPHAYANPGDESAEAVLIMVYR